MTMTKLTRLIIFLSALGIGTALPAMPVEKINQRGAKAAWGLEQSIFNPEKPIPDTLANNYPAVIIARYWSLDAIHESTPSIVKEQRSDYGSNITRAKEIDRSMVKLLDKSAVEYFSSFEFGDKEEEWYDNIKLTDIEEGFGVRIYKPDGSMHEIDLSQALPITDGKKGDKKRNNRITIPGLEVGDVIDYFYYTEETREEFDISRRRISFATNYPMLDFIAESSVDPTLTLEMRAFNGAPLPDVKYSDKANRFNLHTANLGAIPAKKFINVARQVPFLEMRVLNNNAKMRFKPKSARPGGVYVLSSQAYYDDIANFIRRHTYKSGVAGRAADMVKKQRKAHPEWKERKLADYAYVATMYQLLIDDESYDLSTMAFILRDAADKAKFSAPAGIGFINSSLDVPTSQITSWKAPDYVTLIGERPYLPSAAIFLAPGEWPASYQAEEGGCFRKIPEEGSVYPEMFTIPATSPNSNTRMDNLTLTIDPASTQATINGEISAVGVHKLGLTTAFNNKHTWLQLAEDYLGIEPEERYRDTKFDSLAYNKLVYERMKEDIKERTGIEPLSVDTVLINSRGVMPDAKSFGCSYRATFDNITSDAGDETIVNIGKFFGDIERITGKDRNRDFDAFMFFPNNYIRKLTFALPEGYSIKPEALEALNKSVNNSVGSFSTHAESADGIVTINVNTQERDYIVPTEKWQQYLDLTDAAADFAGAVLIINKEK